MNLDYPLDGNPANNAYVIRLCEEGRIDELIEFCANENGIRAANDIFFPHASYTVIDCKTRIELRFRTYDRLVDKLLAIFPKQSTK